MDDTYEAEVVQFPDGRLVTPHANQSYVNLVRIADTRFVLDELARLRSGVNPDAAHRKLPSGLSEALDVTKVGMFGHSLGGTTAAKAMAADQRIHAGIDLDGGIIPRLRAQPHRNIRKRAERIGRQLGQRPFMFMTSQGRGAQDDPSVAGFWAGLRGWRLFLSMKNSQHFTYTDLEEFLSQLLAAGIAPQYITRRLVTEFIGTVPPSRAVAAERAYIAAFFDLAPARSPQHTAQRPLSRVPPNRVPRPLSSADGRRAHRHTTDDRAATPMARNPTMTEAPPTGHVT